jgi:hypothetical protein
MSRPKGFKLTKEHKENISKAKIGKKQPWSGKSITPEGREKLRLSTIKTHKGRKQSKEEIARRLKSKEGYKHSEETKRKIGLANSISQRGKPRPWSRGENSPAWKGGITPINEKIRKSLEYRLWRTAVFERDDYTCVWCGQKGGKLHADHIKPFAYYPELRFAIDNGRTLCIECHLKTDTYSNRYKFNK